MGHIHMRSAVIRIATKIINMANAILSLQLSLHRRPINLPSKQQEQKEIKQRAALWPQSRHGMTDLTHPPKSPSLSFIGAVCITLSESNDGHPMSNHIAMFLHWMAVSI